MSDALGNGNGSSARALVVSRELLEELFAGYQPRDFAVRFWDGTTLGPDRGEGSRFTLVLRHPGALRSMFGSTSRLETGLAEAYLCGDFDIEGELEAVFPLADHLLIHRDWSLADRLRFARRLLALRRSEHSSSQSGPARLRGHRLSLRRARQAIAYHYNLNPGFYPLFLDRRMTYSCAYYADPDEDLDTAQERKLDYVCRKLRLRPGERLLDIGCGWGSLILYACERYGVQALGVTLSEPQAEVARERIRVAGLADRCRVEVCDYRELSERESFDKLASVGMFEHVAETALPDYFQRAWELLRGGGVFLNHGIAEPVGVERRRGGSFTMAYLFPDCELVPISTTLRAAEAAKWEVRDVESLREHYVLMVREWRRRLEANDERARALVGDETYRAWRLGMAGIEYGQAVGRLNVYQTLLAKPLEGRSGLPLTRADWYEERPAGGEAGRELVGAGTSAAGA